MEFPIITAFREVPASREPIMVTFQSEYLVNRLDTEYRVRAKCGDHYAQRVFTYTHEDKHELMQLLALMAKFCVEQLGGKIA